MQGASERALHFESLYIFIDHLCGIVVRVPGYRSGDPWFNSRHYKKY
jgi:hypothetical protein